jgi:hypothetical protein
MQSTSLAFLSSFFLAAATASSALAQGTVTCQPGTSGVITCPCANAPSGPGRGCNNSLNTGGAMLTATGPGSNSLSSDSVQLNCTGIGSSTPSCSGSSTNILCILYEGTTASATGVLWGDGVICTGGTFFVLNVQTSNGGIFHFPVPGTTGLSQSALAAGDPLVVGATRDYFVAYRDSCPSFCTPSLRQKSNSYQIIWGP